ncbi:MAG: hypothetical protein Q8Q41_02795 [bacterium]|nr:hypothetical protein [bacterium]
MRHGIAATLIVFGASAFPVYAKEPPIPPMPEFLQEMTREPAVYFDTALENLYGVWTAKIYWQTVKEKTVYMVRIVVTYDGKDYIFPNEINEKTILEISWIAYPPGGGEPQTFQWTNVSLVRTLVEKMKQRHPGGGNI